jgi:hypothetical protein
MRRHKKDVKNEGWSGYMYENTGEQTKCRAKSAAFCTKTHPLHGKCNNGAALWAENARNRQNSGKNGGLKTCLTNANGAALQHADEKSGTRDLRYGIRD